MLICDDCLNVLRKMESHTVDLVVTDPPYEISITGGGLVKRAVQEMQVFTQRQLAKLTAGIPVSVLDELCRVMKQINIYLWCGKKQVPFLLDYFVNKRGCNFDLLSWHKSNPTPLCGNKYLSDTEYCLFFRGRGVRIYGTFATKKTHFTSAYSKALKNKYQHPTIKPLDFIRNMVVNSSQPGDLVLDPYCGTGTTGVACIETGRRFIGIEIEPKYYRASMDRISEIPIDE